MCFCLCLPGFLLPCDDFFNRGVSYAAFCLHGLAILICVRLFSLCPRQELYHLKIQAQYELKFCILKYLMSYLHCSWWDTIDVSTGAILSIRRHSVTLNHHHHHHHHHIAFFHGDGHWPHFKTVHKRLTFFELFVSLSGFLLPYGKKNKIKTFEWSIPFTRFVQGDLCFFFFSMVGSKCMEFKRSDSIRSSILGIQFF